MLDRSREVDCPLAPAPFERLLLPLQAVSSGPSLSRQLLQPCRKLLKLAVLSRTKRSFDRIKALA